MRALTRTNAAVVSRAESAIWLLRDWGKRLA